MVLKGWHKALLGVLAVGMFIGIPMVSTYNGLVTEQSNVENAWANVDSKLQRRYDLIPNLVNAVKGSMAQEKEIFTAIAEARSEIGGATNTNEKIEANAKLEKSVTNLLAVVENYPELKSNDNVQGLMTELAGTENRISVERDRYNEAVRGYNNKTKKFPTSMFANMFGFEEVEYFEAVDDATVAPTVDLTGE